jgi:histidine triad (HIT) family protein
MRAFKPRKIGLMIAGLEVPHAHVHVVPIQDESDLDFTKAKEASQESLAETAQIIRQNME